MQVGVDVVRCKGCFAGAGWGRCGEVQEPAVVEVTSFFTSLIVAEAAATSVGQF